MYKEIVSEAWEIVRENKNFIKYGNFVGFFYSIVGIAYLSYQIYSFYKSDLFGYQEKDYTGLFVKLWEMIVSHPNISGTLLGFAILSLLMYMFAPIVCDIIIISKTFKIKTGEKKNAFNFQSFMVILQFSTMFSVVGIIPFIQETTLILKNFGFSIFIFFLPFLVILLLSGLISSFLCIFSIQYIVLEDCDLSDSIKKSSNLVLGNLGDNFLIWGIILLIMIRVVINFVILISIPLIFFSIIGFFSNMSLFGIGVFFGSIIGIILIYFVIKIISIFYVFTNVVWTLAFLKIKSK